MEYEKRVLPNGIRALHKEDKSKVAHIAIMINAGTRDENDDEGGMAHFIEHTLFKGTQKRKSHHINNRLDAVGGEINAFTTKEETCIYTTSLHSDYERALELLTDITFHSTFPEKELEKEKEVVADEINSYKDSPSELIFDDFEDLVFEGHPIGRNILGTPESLQKLSRNQILEFIRKNYLNNQIVVASVGDLKMKTFDRLIHKYFAGRISQNTERERQAIENYQPKQKVENKNTYQTHCVYGNVAFDIQSKYRTALSLLNNLIGGPGLNSRLNSGLREKYGLVYSIESNVVFYSDTGVFNVYFGSDKGNFNRAMLLIQKELKKLQTDTLSPVQLERAKRQLMGQIAISHDNREAVMISVAKNTLHRNKYDTLEEIFKKIALVSAEDILTVANLIFDEKQMTTLVYQ